LLDAGNLDREGALTTSYLEQMAWGYASAVQM
jgi:hypothetical protein